jgi:hypothetical protein
VLWGCIGVRVSGMGDVGGGFLFLERGDVNITFIRIFKEN